MLALEKNSTYIYAVMHSYYAVISDKSANIIKVGNLFQFGILFATARLLI